jgi:hypothetical protein
MNSLFDHPTTPSNCTLGLALPTSLDELHQHLAQPEKYDFATHLGHLYGSDEAIQIWEAGYQALSRKITSTLSEVEEHGVQIIRGLKLGDLRYLREGAVTTLIAHWGEQQSGVELADGIHSPGTIAEAMPENYRGVLDLTVCYSSILLDTIKRSHPNCIVVANKGAAILEFRLIFYKYLIRMMATKSIHYVDATTQLRLLLLNG